MKESVVLASLNADVKKKVAETLVEHFLVEDCQDAAELTQRVRISLPAIILIDVPVTEEEKEAYRQWIVEFRQNPLARKIPILVLSDSIDEKKWLLALSVGATDFLLKPINERELRIRVIGLTHATSSHLKGSDVLVCGNLKLNTASYEVRVNEESITLSVLEFNLLRYFILNKERVLGREQVITSVWPNSEVLDRAVDTHVVSLRRKLTGWDYSIITVYRAGYILKKEDH